MDGTQALGEVQKEEGQAEELAKAGNTVLKPKKDSNVKGEKETPKNDGKEKPEVKPESTHEDDVTVLQEEKGKLEKRVKDQESFIGKQTKEVGDLRKVVDTVKNATTTEEKKEAKDKVTEVYDEAKKSLTDQGYTETEADTQLKPMLKMIKASDRERRLEEAHERISKIQEYVETSKDINLNLFKENEKDIVEELGTYNPAWITKNPKKAVHKAYKSVIHDKAEKARKANKKGDEEERENEIAGQASPSPKSKGKPSNETEYSGENIANAGPGRIFD